MKFLKEGEPNQDVFDFIAANVRVPSQVIGDIYAQVTAQQVCAERLGNSWMMRSSTISVVSRALYWACRYRNA